MEEEQIGQQQNVEQQQMLLVGLNDPNLNNDIDKEWSNRRQQQRPKTALHDRRQQQLQQLKSQYLSNQEQPIQKETIKQEKHIQQPLSQNKELAAQFVVALEKFNDNLTRDSGVSLCYNMIEKNKDQQSIQTMIECIYSSSKKNINPKTNSQNTLAIDMELITLAEIIKQNDTEFNSYLIDKIISTIKKHINCSSDTTIQAIAQVLIQLLDKINISQIYSQLSDCLYDKSKQIQFVNALCFVYYYLKQQNKIDEFNILGALIYDIYQKLLLDSLELLKCIEFLLLINFNMNNEIIITRALKYCQVPINKNSKYYLIVCQACKIIQHMGTKTRSMSKEVLQEMEKLINDRRVDVQIAAKNVISVWKQQEIKQIEPNFDQFYNKVAFVQTPYTEYQKRGFQSLLRASSFVRKNSRSPSLPNKQPDIPKQSKIREKIKKIRSGSPKFQMLEEETEEVRRNQALQSLKGKINEKQQQQQQQQLQQQQSYLNDENEIFEDSLEIDQLKKPLNQIKQQVQENPIIEQQQEELQDSLALNEPLKQLNKMPSIQYIDNLQTIKKSLHENQNDIQQGEDNNLIDDFENQQQINKIVEQQNSHQLQSASIKQQLNTFEPEPNNKYQKVQQEIEKVRAGNLIKQNSEQEVEIDDDDLVEKNQDILNKPFQIKEIQNFEASIQEIQNEFISKNNKIDYQQELLNESNQLSKKSEKFEMDTDLYQKEQGEIKVKSGQNEKQEEVVLDQTIEEMDQIQQKDDLQHGQIDQIEQSVQSQLIDQFQKQIKPLVIEQNDQKVQKPVDKANQLITNKNKQRDDQSQVQTQNSQKSKENSNRDIIQIDSNHQQSVQQRNQQNSQQKKQQISQRSLIEQNQQNKVQEKQEEKKKNQIKYKLNRQNLELALNKGRQNINDGYQILFDNCDDLQKIQFMMMVGPQIGKLNNKTMNKILEFMSKIKQCELLNILGLSLYKQVKECNYFDEISKEELQNVKEVLYEMSGSEQENIGMQAANLYNEI